MFDKLISCERFIVWLRSLTQSELDKFFPTLFHKINALQSKEETVMDLLANDAILYRICTNYAKILFEEISLDKFVPVKDGKVLSERDRGYETALKKVYFEGFYWAPSTVHGERNVMCLRHKSSGQVWYDSESQHWRFPLGASQLAQLVQHEFTVTKYLITKIFQ